VSTCCRHRARPRSARSPTGGWSDGGWLESTPHVGTHDRAAFVDTNISGTLVLLEEAVRAGVSSFVFTSTTSAFGAALRSQVGEPAVWVTEDLVPVSRNIYGTTKVAAENICELVHRDHRLPVVVLRVSRFFPEPDDDDAARATYRADNIKVNEYLYRRVDLQDVVDAHLLAAKQAPRLGFARFVISATTPFRRSDADLLGHDAPAVVEQLFPDYPAEFARRQWTMLPRIDRVYDNHRARVELGWAPRYDFRHVLDALEAGEDYRSPLARQVGAKGYHAATTGIYTTR
jgi:nucleoside-diphosphate-sugar epimerase